MPQLVSSRDSRAWETLCSMLHEGIGAMARLMCDIHAVTGAPRFFACPSRLLTRLRLLSPQIDENEAAKRPA